MKQIFFPSVKIQLHDIHAILRAALLWGSCVGDHLLRQWSVKGWHLPIAAKSNDHCPSSRLIEKHSDAGPL